MVRMEAFPAVVPSQPQTHGGNSPETLEIVSHSSMEEQVVKAQSAVLESMQEDCSSAEHVSSVNEGERALVPLAQTDIVTTDVDA